MDSKRAKEIAASPMMVNVTHSGFPVYIESVSYLEQKAFVHTLNQPKNRMKVEVSSLTEQTMM